MHGLNELPVLIATASWHLTDGRGIQRRRRWHSQPGAIGPCKGAWCSQAGLRVFNSSSGGGGGGGVGPA